MSAKRAVRPAPVRVTESSGNVFADLGVAHPERELIKAELALQIYRIIRERRLSQKQVGKMLGVSQPQVSVLARKGRGEISLAKGNCNDAQPGVSVPQGKGNTGRAEARRYV